MPARRPAKRGTSSGTGETGGAGYDTEGKSYSSLAELWSGELNDESGRNEWYAKGEEYWKDREVSLDGILGGYGVTHEPDIKESRQFLEALKDLPAPPLFQTALDAGAGIGRVATSLLQEFCQTVDLVEPNERFLAAAEKALPADRLGHCVAKPLQLFRPEFGRYDLIWAQGVLLYLPDDDLVRFLELCKLALRENGVFCIKDNVVLSGKFWVDREDNSVARTDEQMKSIFAKSGMELLQSARQQTWPEGLLPVIMYALRPAAPSVSGAAQAARGASCAAIDTKSRTQTLHA